MSALSDLREADAARAAALPAPKPVAPAPLPTLAEYYSMLERHDWTYDYSDDSKTWRRGLVSLRALQAIAQRSPAHADLLTAYSDHVWKRAAKPTLPMERAA